MKPIKNKQLSIIYVSGNGHSGSTLLDIMLGSVDGCFSAGELNFITRDSINEEYCSCQTIISDCDIWSLILEKWEKRRDISYAEYQSSRLKYERNKVFLTALWNSWFPSQDYLRYCRATQTLFEVIKEVTKADFIIDSSKAPTRIPILNKIADVRVIHLCRDFKGVLNSAKKSSVKDIRAGIEEDNPARSTVKTLLDWILNNFLCELFKVRVSSIKIKYKDYIQYPAKLSNIHPIFKEVTHIDTFNAEHMLAGNVIRLKKILVIDKSLGFQYKRLSDKEKKISSLIDSAFWFWS